MRLFGKCKQLFYRYKHGGANVKCTMCDTTFAHEVKLKAHMKNVHTYVVSQTLNTHQTLLFSIQTIFFLH